MAMSNIHVSTSNAFHVTNEQRCQARCGVFIFTVFLLFKYQYIGCHMNSYFVSAVATLMS